MKPKQSEILFASMDYIEHDMVESAAIAMTGKKKYGRLILKWSVVAAAICVLISSLTFFAILRNTGVQPGPITNPEPTVAPPMTMLVPENPTTGEFAGDMHRPEGFHKNIGSALALKMTVVEESDYQFRVVTYTYDDNMEEIVAGANQNLDEIEKIDFYTFRTIVVVNEHAGGRVEAYPWKQYFCNLTAEQIYALAEAGATCLYVGSGESKVDVDWTSSKGIDAFCELHGDMYIMWDNENQIKCYPDIWAE